jgi:hypothetical protein
MRMKVAKLVYVDLLTRVVVHDDATDDEIIACARQGLINKVLHELNENVTEIKDDTEMPYNDGEEMWKAKGKKKRRTK